MGSTDRVRRPFWLHQAAEYLVGIALIAQGLQAAEPAVPGVAGALVVVNAAVVRGPLSAFDVVGRRLHRVFDVVLIVALAVAAIAPWVETPMRVVLGAFAIVLGFVARYTRYDTQRGAQRTSPGSAPPGSGTPGDRAEDLGRRAGRLAGQGVKAWRARR